MKWLREEIEIIVFFSCGEIMPIRFRCERGISKIISINKTWDERRNLHDCKFFLCLLDDGKIAEIKWDINENKWYLEKL